MNIMILPLRRLPFIRCLGLLAGALCVSAFAADINLTADAYSKGSSYFESGWGEIDSGKIVGGTDWNSARPIDMLFKGTLSNRGERFMAAQPPYTNYVAIHFQDNYEPGKVIVAHRLYLNVYKPISSSALRRPRDFVLQGANDPGSHFVAGADTTGDLRASSEGWTDIASWDNTAWTEGTFSGLAVLEFDGAFQNTTPYRYYRLLITKTNGDNSWLQFSRLHLYGEALNINPAGLSVSVSTTEDSADIALSCSAFSEADPAIASGPITLDWATDPAFGTFFTIPLADNVTGTDWSTTYHFGNLTAATTYYGRFIVPNSAGGVATNLFTFATLKAWFVSGSGSDDTGDGTAANPFRTLTHTLADIAALDPVPPRPVVNIDEGVYSAAAGETFPLAIPSGTIMRGWSATGAAIDRDTRVIDGEDALSRLLVLSSLASDCTISDLAIRNTRRYVPVYIEASDATITNCLFTQGNADANNSAGVSGALEINGLSRVTVDDCVFRGITNRAYAVQVTGVGTASGAEDARLTTIRRCLFEDNRLVCAAAGGVTPNAAQVSLAVEDSVFQRNVFTTATPINNTQTPGGCIAVCGYRVGNDWYGSLVVNRCRFLGNTGNTVVGAQFVTKLDNGNDGSFVVANSLFADNQPYNATGSGAKFATVSGYRGYPVIRNCTFLRNFGSFAQNSVVYIYNSIMADETMSLAPGSTYSLNFSGVNLVTGCTPGTEAMVSGLANAIDADPCFVSAAVAATDPAFDARLRAFSPAIDAGNASIAYGATDLAGNARVADNLGTGTALLDLGCFESTYLAEIGPAFRMPSNERVAASLGSTVPIEVRLVNAADLPASAFPVTATLDTPAGWSCPATLSFSGDSATFTATIPYDAPLGTYTLAVSAPGVAPALFDVIVADERVTLTGDRLLVLRTGDEPVTLPFRMATDGVAASAPIAFSIESSTGAGIVSAEWDGTEGRVIPAGATETEAGIVFTPLASGYATVTFRSGADFAESGSEEFTLDIAVDPPAFHVDPANGSDATGIGSEARPFRTITAASSYAAPGDTLVLAAGEYTAAAEAFPLDVPGLVLEGATGNPADVILDGTNGVASLFARSSSYATPAVLNATLRNTTAAIADLMDASIAFTNCVILQSRTNIDEPAIANLFRASRLDMADCVVSNFNRYAAVAFDTVDADLGSSAPRSRDRWFAASRCLFDDARCERAFVASRRNNGSPNDVRLADCTFSRLRMYTDGSLPGSGSNVYYAGLFHLPTSLAQGGDLSCWFTADRCVFKACKGCTFFSGSHANAPVLRNCLFADMTNSVSLLWGNAFFGAAQVRNCTFVRTSGGFAGFGLSTMVDNSIIEEGEMMTARLLGSTVTVRSSLLHDTAFGAYAYVTNVVDETSYTVATNLYLGANVIFDDPLFRNAGVDALDPAFDASLRTTSPAIDAGDNALAAGDVDLLGNARIFHRTVDLGCYEAIDVVGGTLFLLR